MATTTRGAPYPLATDTADPALDLRRLADWVDARPGVSTLTTAQRDALTGADLWDGRVILNLTAAALERYDATAVAWRPTAPTDVLPALGQGLVAFLERALVRSDTRSSALTYTGANLTRIEDRDGTTVVRAVDLTYDGAGNLTRTVEAAGGRQITTDLTYDGNGNLTGTTRTVV